jgi:hypothetical protein
MKLWPVPTPTKREAEVPVWIKLAVDLGIKLD